MHSVLIVGFGNTLLRDEGIGSWVVQELKKRELPANVEVIDGGTLSLDVLLDGRDIQRLIIVDALKGGGDPGTVYRVPWRELLTAKTQPLSLHQFDLLHILWLIKQMKIKCRDITIIGVEPREVEWGMGLSEDIQKKLPEIVGIVLKEVEDAHN
ncbi:MAG TPA: hydrogenase maturation protease [Candidatus Omnitrophica bacterium]|nr:hydrogenase maturation protease [Candidatus Omnitrophota bacterium]